ncbi:MAG: hypothetical protein WDM96_01835 [Lacunisphaera sp.]
MEKARKVTDLTYSGGLVIGREGEISAVLWDSPGLQCGLTVGTKLIAVNGRAYDNDQFKAALKDREVTAHPAGEKRRCFPHRRVLRRRPALSAARTHPRQHRDEPRCAPDSPTLNVSSRMFPTCPLCRGALVPAGKSYRCAQGHTFDLAKEGYLSLLHGRQKGEGRGDSQAMILARDRVHRAGVFDPLVSALAALPLDHPPATLLDLGCGEGFFLGHVVRSHRIATSYGLDLSVDAVKLAAKTQEAVAHPARGLAAAAAVRR